MAEIFAARSGGGGVFLALPTMAIGNAMFPRLLKWLERLPSLQGQRRSVLLAHSKSALNDEFTDLMEVGKVVAVELDADVRSRSPSVREAVAALVAHIWLRGRKKAMLSSFVAGTVDQLLFAGLKSKHLALRYLAVAGKVVVIDDEGARGKPYRKRCTGPDPGRFSDRGLAERWFTRHQERAEGGLPSTWENQRRPRT